MAFIERRFGATLHWLTARIFPGRERQAAKILGMGGMALALIVAGTFAAEAQQQRKIPRLCFLTFDPGTLQKRSPRFDGFFQGLRDLGYVDGKTIAISYLSADNNGDRFPTLIDECMRLKPDIIAVTTTPAAQLLKKATRNIPIVLVVSGAPLETGLVDSLSKPSGNITGMSLMVPQLAAKRLELMRELVPGIARILVLSFGADPIAPPQVKAMEAVAPKIGVTLQVHSIRTAEEITAAFDAASRAAAQGVLVTEESIFIVHSALVTELAARHKMPAIYPFALPVVDAGGLMAYEANAPEVHRHAAGYVDRILRGAKPSDLPVQQPMRFELVINLKTAEALGLTIPQTVLLRATRTIQ